MANSVIKSIYPLGDFPLARLAELTERANVVCQHNARFCQRLPGSYAIGQDLPPPPPDSTGAAMTPTKRQFLPPRVAAA